MTRLLTIVLAAIAVLVAAGCGDGGSATVDGQTTPTASTPASSTTPTTTTPAKIDVAAQMARLKPCVGGTAAETYKWFQPTVDYAKSMGGDGFTVTLEGKPVTLIVFPYEQAAQYGSQDITDRLIALQQKRPTDYATVAATATQVLGGNVVEVSTAGATSATVNSTLVGCIAQSRG